MVFYTEGEDLYRFNVEDSRQVRSPNRKHWRKRAKRSQAAPRACSGRLGISTENGSYAYFVATDVLADNENGNEEKAKTGKANLYEWHDGETTFIARLEQKGNMMNTTGVIFIALIPVSRLPQERRARGSLLMARRYCLLRKRG